VLTETDVEVCGFSPDYELPVFEAHGVKFGIQICHDSGFPEIAAALVAQGARLLFSPQFTLSAPGRVDQHRLRARNVHAGLAALFGLVVVRANIVSSHDAYERLGYGDSAIFSPLGTPLAEAGLFTTALAHADVAPWLLNDWTARRFELPERLIHVAADHMRRAAARSSDERPD
jgi:predicted amidohydrolase